MKLYIIVGCVWKKFNRIRVYEFVADILFAQNLLLDGIFDGEQKMIPESYAPKLPLARTIL